MPIQTISREQDVAWRLARDERRERYPQPLLQLYLFPFVSVHRRAGFIASARGFRFKGVHAMGGQHGNGRLDDLKRAYDDYLHGLFGDNVPNERFRENLASGILYLARADKRDWESMAKHTGAPVANLIAKRDLLIRHET
jgi:hypothetical protein